MPGTPRPKVLLLIPHLGGGGAEHVVETLARFLDREKHEILFGIVTGSHFDLANSMAIANIYQLNASRIRYSSLKLLRLIWSFRPAVILSGMAHLNLLVLLLRPVLPKRTGILVRHNGALSATLSDGIHPCIARLIYGFAYRRADIVICQSESMKDEIRSEFGVNEARLAVLRNPVDSDLIRSFLTSDSQLGIPRLRLVALGRLVREKGFDLLLDAFAGVSSRYSEAELLIAGSGRLEAFLKEQSRRLGIGDRVRFCGYVPNPAMLFRDASLFVLSSRTEGIPNALLEAGAAGLPIVATPASGGLVDLVAKQKGVWLASEISIPALRTAIESALEAIEPGQRHKHHWVEPFDIRHAVPAYEAVIERSIEGVAV